MFLWCVRWQRFRGRLAWLYPMLFWCFVALSNTSCIIKAFADRRVACLIRNNFDNTILFFRSWCIRTIHVRKQCQRSFFRFVHRIEHFSHTHFSLSFNLSFDAKEKPENGFADWLFFANKNRPSRNKRQNIVLMLKSDSVFRDIFRPWRQRLFREQLLGERQMYY